MIQLNESGVFFNEFSHSYWLDGKELHGITGMIQRQLFPDLYAGVSKKVLDEAARFGNYVHNCCELYDENGHIAQEFFMQFYIKYRQPFTPVAQEYIVTDRQHFASPIDLVWERDGQIILADIKSTTEFNAEYLSWQLSIYAYLFELQNPGLEVSKLYGLQIRNDKHKMAEIARKPDSEVIRLMEAEAAGEKFYAVTAPESDNLPVRLKEACEEVLKYQEMASQAKENLERLKAGLYEAIKDSPSKIKKFEGYGLRLTLVKESRRETLDKKKLFDEHPEINQADYIKQTTVKGTVKITRI